MKKLKFVPLEERIVLDAAVAHAAAPTDTTATTHAATPTAVLVVSNAVPDAQHLAEAAKAGVAVVTYDPNNTSLDSLAAQINQATNGAKVSSIGFATEGGIYGFNLTGTEGVTATTLSSDANLVNFWKNIAGNLLPDGNIAILSCNVNASAGQQMLNMLDSIVHDVGTNLSVFASTDSTGSAALGGNWILERGNFDAGAAFFDTTALGGWNHIMGQGSTTINVTYLDFNPAVYNNPDFNGSQTPGYYLNQFLPTLGPDGTPQLNPAFHPDIQNNSSFYDWFHYVPGHNALVNGTITFVDQGGYNMLYLIPTGSYDPINGQGFGNDSPFLGQNTNFTMHAQFQVTSATGVLSFGVGAVTLEYVYVNGTLVAQDHVQQSGTIADFQSIAVPQGQTVTVDAFFAANYAGPQGIQLQVVGGLINAPATATPVYTPIDTVTNEAGDTGSFSVYLSTAPFAPVTISYASFDPTEAFVVGNQGTATVTFDINNWNIPQVITVQGVADNTVDGNQNVFIGSVITSADGRYQQGSGQTPLFTNIDLDTAAITKIGGGSITTSESGTSGSFQLVLTSIPQATVVIPISLTNAAEGSLSTNSVVFNASNWSTPQTVTVTGLHDFVDTGAGVNYSILIGASSSADGNYNGLTAPSVSVTNVNIDVAGVQATGGPLTTSETGGSDTFQVALTSKPLANVVIPITSSDPTQDTLSVSSLTFTPTNWNIAQTVTVTGLHDFIDTGNGVTYSVNLGPSSSTDAKYVGKTGPSQTVTNTNIDVAGFQIIGGPITTSETGGTSSFQVELTSKPLGTVVVPITSTDPTQGLISTSFLTFTPTNWNTPQTVTVSGLHDFIDTGSGVTYSIGLGPSTSTDANYSGFVGPSETVTNTNIDVAGVTVTPVNPGPLITNELGGGASITVQLDSKPLADVDVPIFTSDPDLGTTSVSVIHFTPSDWNIPQTVTLNGQHDFIDNVNESYSLQTGTPISTDGKYNTLPGTTNNVISIDPDHAGYNIDLPPIAYAVVEGQTITVDWGHLSSKPIDPVTVTVTTTRPDLIVIDNPTVQFDGTNWNADQSITFHVLDNHLVDPGNLPFQLVFTATSADPNYQSGITLNSSIVNTTVAAAYVNPNSGNNGGNWDSWDNMDNLDQDQEGLNGLGGNFDHYQFDLGSDSHGWAFNRFGNRLTGVQDDAFSYFMFAGPGASFFYVEPMIMVTGIGKPVIGIGTDSALSVSLSDPPREAIDVRIISSDAEGTKVTPEVIRFTPENWSVPQVVHVEGTKQLDPHVNQPVVIDITSANPGTAEGSGAQPTKIYLQRVPADAPKDAPKQAILKMHDEGSYLIAPIVEQVTVTPEIHLDVMKNAQGSGKDHHFSHIIDEYQLAKIAM